MVFTARDFLQDVVSNFFNQHLISTFHVFNRNCPERIVRVMLQGVFVLHNVFSALLIFHLHEDCPEGWLGGII